MKVIRAIAITVLLISAATVAFGQEWQFGADGGVGLLNTVPAKSPGGSATAGIAPGFVAGVSAGESLRTRLIHFSGEIRYEYVQSDLRLAAGGQTARFSGAAHAIHYDVVYHTNRGESPVQFFGAVGGGIKAFFGTGTEEAYQPLSQYGYFTKTHTMKPMITAAAGFTYRLGPKLLLRVEGRDFMSAFPTAVLTPPQGVKYGALLNEIVPMVSIIYVK